MGDVGGGADTFRYVWTRHSIVKQQQVLRQSLTAKTSGLLAMFGCYQKRLSLTPAELWFGEGRLPSAGRLVELQSRRKRRGKVGKERWWRGPVFTCFPLLFLLNSSGFTQLLFGSHSTQKKKKTYHNHAGGPAKHHGGIQHPTRSFIHKVTDDTRSCLGRVISTCDGMRVKAGMRSRAARAGRHHQQSTDDDNDGGEFWHCSTGFVSGSKRHNQPINCFSLISF